MKIVVQGPPRRNLASESQKPRKYPTITPIANTQKLTYPTSASIQSVPLVLSPSAFRQALSASIISQITQKMNLYTNINPQLLNSFDYLDLPQNNANKVISIEDFAGSNTNVDNFNTNFYKINNQINN